MEKKPETAIITPKQKTKSDKLRKLIIFTVGPILLILILYLYGLFSFIGVRIYNGDRIKGQIYFNVDGKEYLTSSATAYYKNSSVSVLTEESTSPKNDVLSEKTNENSVQLLPVNTFAIKGGEVGTYTIDFRLNKKKLYELTQAECFNNLNDDLIIHFKYDNKNWYYITDLKLTVFITTEKNGITCNLKAYYYADNAERYKVSGTVTQPVHIDDLSKTNEVEFVIYK